MLIQRVQGVEEGLGANDANGHVIGVTLNNVIHKGRSDLRSTASRDGTKSSGQSIRCLTTVIPAQTRVLEPRGIELCEELTGQLGELIRVGSVTKSLGELTRLAYVDNIVIGTVRA